MASNLFKKIVLRNYFHCRCKSLNSHDWLARREKDRYVELAKTENYRCRSAYKLLEINEKYKFIHPGMCALDLGAAPGSWTQVLVRKTNADGKDPGKSIGRVISIDRQPIFPIEHATILSKSDFTLPESQNRILESIGNGRVDLVVSDMAPKATGVRSLDQDAIFELAHLAIGFATRVSSPRATCLVKIWDGGRRPELEKEMLLFYKTVKFVRPKATQTESTEMFLLARGLKETLKS